MIHYTLSTGHSRHSPRSEVSRSVIDALEPLLVAGEHDLPRPNGYRLKVDVADDALICTVFAPHQRPCVTWCVAPDDATAEQLWPIMEEGYLGLTDHPGFRSADFAAPKRPESTPWCAAYTVLATPDEAGWIADLERCIAWAWIERVQGRGET